jgi:hypothetical protein
MCEKFVAALLTISLLSISVFAKSDLGDWNNGREIEDGFQHSR